MYRLTLIFCLLASAGCQIAGKPGALATNTIDMQSVVEKLVPIGTPIEEAVKIMQDAGFSVNRVTTGQGSGRKNEPATQSNVIEATTDGIECYRSKIQTGLFSEQWVV